ncbi:vomeronasal type-2 receptor 26-like [Pleurodeles waltl]|uniref:vomeronasal type-2 receptor 26-like n=1 Tax=Pleurodeles waltl TaxID=8319 RepID=UPI003709A3E2
MKQVQCFILISMMGHCTVGDVSGHRPRCTLRASKQSSMYMPGDLMIGGVIQRHLHNIQYRKGFSELRDPWHCFWFSLEYVLQGLAFIYAIEEINRNPDILPNLTLGYNLFDSCASEMKAVQSALSIMSQQMEPIPNYRCQSKGHLVGFIGDVSSTTTYSMAQLLALYKYPLLNSFLQRVHFKTADGNDISFYFEEELQAKYDILNWVYDGFASFKAFKVGHLDLSAPPDHQLLINQSSIRWFLDGHYLNQNETPPFVS